MFIPVLQYILGLAVFGFVYWLIGGILTTIINTGVHITGLTFDFLYFIWLGVLFVYIIFGGLWLLKTFNEDKTGGIF